MANYIRKQLFGDTALFLNGKHLVITGLETFVDYYAIRNESGFIYELRGLSGYTLPWLSKYFNFTYSPLQTTPLPLDPVGQKPGIVSVVTEGICDIAGTISASSGRGAILDFTQPYVYIPISYLIRAPESSANYLAILEPFSTWVWVGLVLSTLAVLLFLCIFTWFPSSLLMNLKKEVIPRSAIKVSNYVVRILLKQAGYYPLSKNASILIVAGVWGLAILLLRYCGFKF